jgi:hypothetical protein
MVKKHFKEQGLVEETKQCRQAECLVRLLALLACLHSWPACIVNLPALWACLPCWPACLVGLPALLACLLCFVLALQSAFLWQPLTVLTRQSKAGCMCFWPFYFTMMSMFVTDTEAKSVGVFVPGKLLHHSLIFASKYTLYRAPLW